MTAADIHLFIAQQERMFLNGAKDLPSVDIRIKHVPDEVIKQIAEMRKTQVDEPSITFPHYYAFIVIMDKNVEGRMLRIELRGEDYEVEVHKTLKQKTAVEAAV